MSSNKSKNKLSITEFLPQVIQQLPQKAKGLITGGIPVLLQKDSDKKSIGKILEENAIRFRDKPAILFEDRAYSYHEFNEIVNTYAHLFLHHGVKRGQVVIVYLENRPEVLFVVGALAKIGAIASMINSNQRSQVLAHSINQDNDGYYVVGEELLGAFQDVQNDIVSPGRKVFIGIEDTGKVEFPKEFVTLDHVIHRFPTTNIKGVKEMKSGTSFAYIFTSGTTGMPKASIQKHRKWVQCMYWFGKVNLNLSSDDVIYVSIPFYHANALLIAWSSAAVAGAAMAIRRKFSVSEFWKDCIRYEATSFIYIGDILRYLYNAPESEWDRKHQVTKIIGNGLRPDIWKSFKYRFNIPEVYEFYASSEGNMTFTNTFNLDHTVGWCATNYEIVEYDREKGEPIYDSKGFMKKVKWGEVGLMLFEISDQYPFVGYVKKEESQKKIYKNVFKNGDSWFNTGDIMRNIGFLHAQFVDREGDTFRWKGENVSTAEVEEIINSYPDVEGSAVYGVDIPHADGKAGMAAILLKHDIQFDWEDFETYLESELPSYAIPVFIRIEKKFEYTSTFKVIKKSLKEESYNQSSVPVWVKRNRGENYTSLTEGLLNAISQEGV